MSTAWQTRLAEIEEFLHFVTVRWPEFRPQVAEQLARRCEKCILSDRSATLKDGLCDACRAADREPDVLNRGAAIGSGEEELHRILHQYEGYGAGAYDALVLFSGGKDSAFLLHRLRTDFPDLRLLAATIDNGFFSPIAMANCRQILQRIGGVDHTFFKPREDLYIKTFRHALTHLNEGGCYATVDRMDGDLAFDIGRNLTASLHIPLMIAGLSPVQVERILRLDRFETRREEERQTRTHSAGFRLDEIYTQEERRKYWWDGAVREEQRIPRVLYPFCAWGYDEGLIRNEVVQRGLIEPGQDSPIATNNDTIPVMLAVDTCRYGYSSFEPEFAELVRAGKADRAMWLAIFQSLEYLCPRGGFMPKSIAETLERLNLTHEDVQLPVPEA